MQRSESVLQPEADRRKDALNVAISGDRRVAHALLRSPLVQRGGIMNARASRISILLPALVWACSGTGEQTPGAASETSDVGASHAALPIGPIEPTDPPEEPEPTPRPPRPVPSTP